MHEAGTVNWRKVTEDDLLCLEEELGLTYKTKDPLKGLSRNMIVRFEVFLEMTPITRFKMISEQNRKQGLWP